jgi:elongation factor Tu
VKNYDIEAVVKNCRKSKNYFADGYRPAFDIHKAYSTSGEISLVDKKRVEYNEQAVALISFLTPEVYPKSIWVGKEIAFREGLFITGYAVVTKIFNKALESDIKGMEGELRMT